jgi:hypothetical protein
MVTIATFDQAAKARIAENVLKEAGIPAAVADETVVAMEWLLSNAVGGVKLQVWEDDADRAVDTLERELGEHGEGLGQPSPEEFAAEAEAATPEDDTLVPEPSAPDQPEVPPTEREAYARRAFYAALFGVVMPPLLFYAIYLAQVALFGKGALNALGRRQVWAAVGLTVFAVIGWWAWAWWAPTDFLFVM